MKLDVKSARGLEACFRIRCRIAQRAPLLARQRREPTVAREPRQQLPFLQRPQSPRPAVRADPLRVRAAVIEVLRVAHGAIVHRRPPVSEPVHVDEHRPGRVPNRALVGVDRARVCGPAGSQPPRRNQPVRTRHESPEIVTLCRLANLLARRNAPQIEKASLLYVAPAASSTSE